jgi:hypothetical protein
VTAPAAQIAKSQSVHSYRVRAIRATRSPVATPCARSPRARVSTSVANSRAVTSVQVPPTRRRNMTSWGVVVAISATMSAMDPG